MTLDQANLIYREILASKSSEPRAFLLLAAVRYARFRTDWQMGDAEQRKAMDQERTAAHNAFIDSCNILSRDMATRGESISWREAMGKDRKDIGDFACYLHLLLGLAAR